MAKKKEGIKILPLVLSDLLFFHTFESTTPASFGHFVNSRIEFMSGISNILQICCSYFRKMTSNQNYVAKGLMSGLIPIAKFFYQKPLSEAHNNWYSSKRQDPERHKFFFRIMCIKSIKLAVLLSDQKVLGYQIIVVRGIRNVTEVTMKICTTTVLCEDLCYLCWFLIYTYQLEDLYSIFPFLRDPQIFQWLRLLQLMLELLPSVYWYCSS